MYIAIIYDLRSEYLAQGFSLEETAEFDRPDTIDAIDEALQQLGHDVVRVGHLKNLVRELSDGRRWDLVFNISEGQYGFAREAQVPALLDAYRIPYTFSDPLVMSVALHKEFTKRLLQSGGIPTADFCVLRHPHDVDAVKLPFPLFAKPIAEGTGKGIGAASIARDSASLKAVCRELLSKYGQPVLLETFLPGREFTVGVVGTGPQAKALGALEVVLREQAEANVYSYTNKEHCEELVEYRLAADDVAEQASAVALSSWRLLGGRDVGRIDLRCDADGRPQLLEINPLPGLHPEHSDLPILGTRLGIPYRDLIAMIVESASASCDGLPCHQRDKPVLAS